MRISLPFSSLLPLFPLLLLDSTHNWICFIFNLLPSPFIENSPDTHGDDTNVCGSVFRLSDSRPPFLLHHPTRPYLRQHAGVTVVCEASWQTRLDARARLTRFLLLPSRRRWQDGCPGRYDGSWSSRARAILLVNLNHSTSFTHAVC